MNGEKFEDKNQRERSGATGCYAALNAALRDVIEMHDRWLEEKGHSPTRTHIMKAEHHLREAKTMENKSAT